MPSSRKNYIIGGGLLAALLVVSGAVYAGYKHHNHHGYGHGAFMMDKEGRGGMRGLHRLDSNNDDQISLAEFTVRATKIFNNLDANQDGTISQDEFLAAPSARFAALDIDANGMIAGEEWPRRIKGHKRGGKYDNHHNDDALPSETGS